MPATDNIKALKNQGASRFKMMESNGTTTLQIFDEIDDWWGFGVRDLAYKLSGKSDKLKIVINSPGGLITEGMGIRGLIKGYNGETECVGIGLVASIATPILLAADKVSMDRDAFFMIHRAADGSWGFKDAEQLRSSADTLENMEEQIISVYLDKIESNGKLINDSREETKEQIIQWMKAETWFTATQALEHGFIDEIVEGVSLEGDHVSDTEMYGEEMYNKVSNYKNAPDTFLNKFSNHKKAGQMAKPKNTKKSRWNKFLDFMNQSEEDIQEDEEQEEQEEEIDEVEAAKELLKKNGFTISEESEEDEEETDEDEDEQEEDEEDEDDFSEHEEMFNSAVNKAVEAKLAELGIKPGGASGQRADKNRGSKGDKTASKATTKGFDNLAKMLKKKVQG